MSFVFSFMSVYGYSLIIVFLQFSEFITGEAHFPLTADALKKVLTGKESNEILLSIVYTVCTTWLISKLIDFLILTCILSGCKARGFDFMCHFKVY
ncbi:hypothetical protein Hanom_Chr16g01433341 [Helianthus anomalus]